jgi:hypothetical protein
MLQSIFTVSFAAFALINQMVDNELFHSPDCDKIMNIANERA